MNSSRGCLREKANLIVRISASDRKRWTLRSGLCHKWGATCRCTMAPIFHYVLLRRMREQGARTSNRSEQHETMDSGGIRCRGDRIAAVAATEVQPPDHPQTDHSMELMFMNAFEGAYVSQQPSWKVDSWQRGAYRNDDHLKGRPKL